MKLHIDTDSKTIKVEGNVKFSELIDELDKRFPDNEWEEFTLDGATTIINYPVSYPVFPYNPSYPVVTYLASGSNYVISNH